MIQIWTWYSQLIVFAQVYIYVRVINMHYYRMCLVRWICTGLYGIVSSYLSIHQPNSNNIKTSSQPSLSKTLQERSSEARLIQATWRAHIKSIHLPFPVHHSTSPSCFHRCPPLLPDSTFPPGLRNFYTSVGFSHPCSSS